MVLNALIMSRFAPNVSGLREPLSLGETRIQGRNLGRSSSLIISGSSSELYPMGGIQYGQLNRMWRMVRKRTEHQAPPIGVVADSVQGKLRRRTFVVLRVLL